jgi:hypothetical protein
MRSLRQFGVFVIMTAACCGCSSSGGGGGGGDATAPPPATVAVKIYHDPPMNTMLWEDGFVLAGPDGGPTSTKHGVWKTYFHETVSGAKGILESEREYDHGTWDKEAAWTWFNPDSSIRDTGFDAIF